MVRIAGLLKPGLTVRTRQFPATETKRRQNGNGGKIAIGSLAGWLETPP
jgi:hypothetical protein